MIIINDTKKLAQNSAHTHTRAFIQLNNTERRMNKRAIKWFWEQMKEKKIQINKN